MTCSSTPAVLCSGMKQISLVLKTPIQDLNNSDLHLLVPNLIRNQVELKG